MLDRMAFLVENKMKADKLMLKKKQQVGFLSLVNQM